MTRKIPRKLSFKNTAKKEKKKEAKPEKEEKVSRVVMRMHVCMCVGDNVMIETRGTDRNRNGVYHTTC